MYKIIGADGKEYGPIAAAQVRQWIAERRLNGQSLVQAEGETGWKPLSFHTDFAADLAAVAPAVSTPVPGTGPTNSMAVASFVMGIVSCFCCIGVFNVLGLVFGFMALSQIKARPEQGGKALAIAGIVLSAIGLVISWVGASFGLAGHLFHAIRNR
jgi:hypothetical protein